MFDSLKERFENIFSSLRGKGKLSEEDINLALREVRRALLEADVNYKVVKDVVEAIRARATGREVLDSITPSQLIFTIVYEELIKIMGDAPAPLVISPKPPTVYMMVGLQGSGKTTTTVKIARRMSKGHKPLVVACREMADAKIGALIVIGQQSDLSLIVEGGIILDAKISAPLVRNIFFKNSPLHDGAIVIEGDRIMAARCILPVTQSDVPKSFGTRHRAAIGMSEISDAIILVVSEETGSISIANNGRINLDINPDRLGTILQKYLISKK